MLTGKGAFEYWACRSVLGSSFINLNLSVLCRVPQGKVVLEVGGGGLRQEIASQGKLTPYEQNKTSFADHFAQC